MYVSTDGMKKADRSDVAPYHVVCMLLVARHAAKQRLPVLFAAESDGAVRVVTEVLEWARASLLSRDLSTVQREVETIGRFIDFCRALGDCISIAEDDLDYVVYAYLLWRKNGTRDDRGRLLLDGLSWKPLDAARLQQEFRALARFFKFCAEVFGFVRLNDKAYRQYAESAPIRRMVACDSRGRDDFLMHLGASREFWSQRTEPETPLIPPATSMRPSSTKAGFRVPIAADEIWAIIAAERNPVFRALWLMGAFGGLRISEQLNLWQIDVLPAAKARVGQ
jgi:hypothetical protein